MTAAVKIKGNDIIMGRLAHGCDLLEGLSMICIDKDIKLGKVEAIGAVQKSCIGFYSQADRQYRFHTFDKPAEILNLTGNISVKDDRPFVHAHITLADESGKAFGGHLSPGTIVFACEFIIRSFDGAELIRQMDNETGLPLWDMK